jgi:hypothetical protein
VLDISEAVVVVSSDAPTNASGVITLTAAGFYLVTADVSFAGAAKTIDTTVEIRVDGVAQAIPVLAYLPGETSSTNRSSTSLSCLVESDGTTTVSLWYNDGSTTFVFYEDGCRLSVCAQ